MIVTATKYSLAPEIIEAGTRGSYGIEKLEFAFSSDWDGLVISVVFYPSRGKPVKIPYLGGEIDIPPEVMAYDGAAQYVLAGTLIDEEGHIGRQIISLTGYIDVKNTLPARGGNSGKITPDVYDKFLDEASKEIEGMVEEALAEAKASGEFKGDPGEMIKDITQTGEVGAGGRVTHKITVTTTDGNESYFYVSDGEDIKVSAVHESTEEGGENVVVFSDGNRISIRNGRSGVHIGPEETMPKGTKVRIDPNGRKVEYAEKSYIVSVFEELKALIKAGNTDGAIAVLDSAILDLAVLG